MKIWLDDQIEPYRGHSFFRWSEEEDPKEWTHVRTVQEVIDAIEAGKVKAIHLDYDLGYSDPGHTGMDVLDYILHALKMKQQLPPPEIFIHTNHASMEVKMWKKVEEIDRYVEALQVQDRHSKKKEGVKDNEANSSGK